jgi:hypothetical protein
MQVLPENNSLNLNGLLRRGWEKELCLCQRIVPKIFIWTNNKIISP